MVCLPIVRQVNEYHADSQSIPCLGSAHSICCRLWQGCSGAQTCSRRSYDQRPWRPFLLLGSSCMKTAGHRPERMGEIMYGAANVGSLMRRSHHTKNPSLPLATPPNAVPAGKLGEADHGPSNSASDSIMMRRDEQPANRGDPTSPPQVQLIWPLSSIPGAGVPAPVDNEQTIDMDGNSFSCRGRLKVQTSIPEYLPTSWDILAS